MMRLREIPPLDNAHGGLVARRDHPELTGALDWLIRSHRLAAVLPGVYGRPELAHLAETRMRAACLRHPDAVLINGAAARVSYWPDAPLQDVEVATRCRVSPAAGFTFIRRPIPPELIRERDGLRFTDPALTAIDLASFDCADSIDIALRTRSATLAGMHEALRLTRKRPGNAERARLLLDSRENPWSAAERLSHRLLRRARIVGWKGNLPIVLEGDQYFIDIAFKSLKLAIEIDGRLHEIDEDLFESDRWRQNALVAAGWRVLRFTWKMLQEHPDVFIAAIRAELP